MATPRRVKKNDEKNYADIYQENFIAQNDPAALGQAAFNRQLRSGIQKNRDLTPVQRTDVKLRSQAERGSFRPASKGIAPNRKLGRVEEQVGPAFRSFPSQKPPMPQPDVALGTSAGDAALGQEFQSGYRGNIPTLEKISGGMMGSQAGTFAGNISASQSGATGYAGQQITRPRYRANIDTTPSVLGASLSDIQAGLEGMRARQTQADVDAATTQARQEQFNALQPTYGQNLTAQGELTQTAAVRDLEQRSLEARRRQAEFNAANEMQEAPGMPFRKPEGPVTEAFRGPQEETAVTPQEELGTVIPGLDKTGGVEKPETNVVTPEVIEKSAEIVTTGVGREEQKINETLDAESNFIQQQFNAQYNQFLQMATSRAEARGSLAAQGFTGGIGQQIQDFLSAAEMQQLNQLMMQRDTALQDIELQRGNAKMQAMQNYLAQLDLQNTTLQAQTQFGQTLAQMVLGGNLSLEEAEAVAAEQGLDSVQSIFESAIQAQIDAGTMDKATAVAELEKLGLSGDFLDVKDVIDGFEYSEEGKKMAEELETLFADPDDAEEGVALGANIGAFTAVGAGIGSFFPPFGTVIGGVIGFIAGSISGVSNAQDMAIAQEDIGDLVSNFGESAFAEQYGADAINGEFESIDIKAPAGASTYGAKFQVSLDNGGYKEMTGEQLVTLALVLKQQNFEGEKYNQIYEQAKKVYEAGRGNTFQATISNIGADRQYNLKTLYESVFK